MKILKSSSFKNKETEKIVKEQVSAIIEDIKINKEPVSIDDIEW